MHEYICIWYAHQILPSLNFCLSSSKENVMKQQSKCKQNDDELISNLKSKFIQKYSRYTHSTYVGSLSAIQSMSKDTRH